MKTLQIFSFVSPPMINLEITALIATFHPGDIFLKLFSGQFSSSGAPGSHLNSLKAPAIPAPCPNDDLHSLVSEVESHINTLELYKQLPPRKFAIGGDGTVILKAFTLPTLLPSNGSGTSVFEA
ncbi:hypothetical protein P691DRAFT_767036 [Macrolepiota fuliginosa MF-IS2]|uniref:Uncharacterized protein n=1 Tax=Macrolepiota fuliginosa MF-IS2 TaxID=1400762 RepID=A0A9P6BWV7_9AGAR|nr:hypothetical protein P691DRAFT_767036 [Macrolepiota fuliginosa MF-IS2]